MAIQVKTFEVSYSCQGRINYEYRKTMREQLENEINEFLSNEKIEIISISYVAESPVEYFYHFGALITYKI